MLSQIRVFTGNIIAKAFFAILLVSFAIWGIGDVFRVATSGKEVAKIGKSSISLEEFDNRYKDEISRVRQNMAMQGIKFSDKELEAMGIKTMVLQKIIGDKLLEQQIKSDKIRISDEVILKLLAKQEEFKTNGKFDKQKFASALVAVRQSEQGFIAGYKDDLSKKALFIPISFSQHHPKFMDEEVYNVTNTERNVQVISVPASYKSFTGKIAEDEVKSYYDSHAEKYSVPESRKISYIKLTPEIVADKVKISSLEIEDFISKKSYEFPKQEKRIIEQIVYTNKLEADDAGKLVKQGKKIADLPGAAAVLGEYSQAELKAILPDVTEKIFSLPVMGVTQPVKIAAGWAVYGVKKIAKPLSREELEKMAHEQLLKEKSADVYSSEMRKIEDDISGGANLNEIATSTKTKIENLTITRNEKSALPSQVVSEIFSLSVNKLSDPIEVKGTFYVVNVVSVTESQKKPVKEVKADIEKSLIEDKTAKLTREFLEDVVKSKSLSGIEKSKVEVTSIEHLKMEDAKDKLAKYKFSGALNEQIFGARDGEVIGAFADNEINPKYFYVANVKLLPATAPSATDLAAISEKLKNMLMEEYLQQYEVYLRTKYPVSVKSELLQPADDREE